MCCYPYSCALAAIWSDVSSAERVVERVKVAKMWCGLVPVSIRSGPTLICILGLHADLATGRSQFEPQAFVKKFQWQVIIQSNKCSDILENAISHALILIREMLLGFQIRVGWQ